MSPESSWPTYTQSQLQLEHEYGEQQQQNYGYGNHFSSNQFNPQFLPSRSSSYSSNGQSQPGPSFNFPGGEAFPSQYSNYNFQGNQYLSASPPVQEPYPMPQRPVAYAAAQPSTSSSKPAPTRAKRPRIPDIADEEMKEEDDADVPGESPKEKAKAGACLRCKNLKVRCEFKTDTDPCKRCLNGGHECAIPGRKKRRTPPKREHLLNQIREQAEQIQQLMSQLQAANKKSSLDSISPVLSPTTTHASFFGPDAAVSPPINPEMNKAVEDWIEKAKDSLNQFGDYIGIGGLPRSYLLNEDPEDPSGSDGNQSDEDNGEGEVPISVISDEEDNGTEGQQTVRHKRSFSSSNEKKDSGGEKLATLPSEAVPYGLMAQLALTNNRGSSGNMEEDQEKGVGVANEDFFRTSPGPQPRARSLVNSNHPPHILTRGIITPADAESLFKIFFETMNLSLSLVDPVLYTAQRTVHRSPFMFTVICAIASRFYKEHERPELYGVAMHYAQLAAGTALISGPKNVELVIGYILLSLYPVPSKRWDDERGWLYLGTAIRIAVELNLHLPNTAKPLNEQHAREQLNRTRVWINCFNLDRSTGSQYGKAPTIRNTDYIANHSEEWWNSSEYNMENFDVHTCCYNAELRVMAGFVASIYNDPNHPTGLNKDAPFENLAIATDEELQALGKKWFTLLEQTDMTNVQNRFRTGLLRLAFSYSRLVALSFGFQYGKSFKDDENPFFLRCVAAARDVVTTVVTDIGRPGQRIYFRHGPEAQRVFLTFAATFLIKLLQPKYASHLEPETRTEILQLIQSAIDFLSSPEVAIDERHGPKVHARFLRGLLAKVDKPSRSRKGSRRPKSSSSSAAPSPGLRHESPASTANSLSPPALDSVLPSFDHQFSPPNGQEYFQPSNYGQQPMSNSNLEMNVNMSDFFYPPLSFDPDIMDSMASLTDPVWQDMASIPGFNLMAQFQNPAPANQTYGPNSHF
ncbi:hypothetical protein C8J56DRAFT_1023845 [Mycena floridula]|nr:hypothetical protein C8J56DRAFT_1023845 [Mycena floridula]